jgi:hypothetical protein
VRFLGLLAWEIVVELIVGFGLVAIEGPFRAFDVDIDIDDLWVRLEPGDSLSTAIKAEVLKAFMYAQPERMREMVAAELNWFDSFYIADGDIIGHGYTTSLPEVDDLDEIVHIHTWLRDRNIEREWNQVIGWGTYFSIHRWAVCDFSKIQEWVDENFRGLYSTIEDFCFSNEIEIAPGLKIDDEDEFLEYHKHSCLLVDGTYEYAVYSDQ